MMHRFRDFVLLLAGIFAGVGGYLIHDSLAKRSEELMVISGAFCCAIAAILLFQLFSHNRDPREPKPE